MSKKKVVIALPGIAQFGDLEQDYGPELEVLGDTVEVVIATSRKKDVLIAQARDADAVLTSWGFRFSREVIEQLEKCVVIGVGSVGVDMIDVDAATEHGIVVTNVPDVFIDEVADHAMMLLLGCARRSKQLDQMVQQGDWFKGRPVLEAYPRLFGRTLGLLAYGNVAQAVARRAKPFGMHIIAYDPYITELKMTADGVEPVTFNELLARSDYLSLHSLLNEETHHLMNESAFARMKNDACIINTSRGPVINEADLIKALQDGQVAAAGLDVLEQEPPEADNPLLTMPNVLISPHAASATSRMRPETRSRAAREVALALRGKWPMSAVNPTVLPRATLERWQPYPMQRGPNR